jgi:hypothetical protein
VLVMLCQLLSVVFVGHVFLSGGYLTTPFPIRRS